IERSRLNAGVLNSPDSGLVVHSGPDLRPFRHRSLFANVACSLGMIAGGMSVSDAKLSSLAASHDIITLGVKADEVRRDRHGVRTTFVRVAEISSRPGAPIDIPATAGEARITGIAQSRAAAVQRVGEVAP